MNSFFRSIITICLIIPSLKTNAQHSTICYGNFNFFNHKEMDKQATCADTLRIECFYNTSGLYKMMDVRKIYGSVYKERINVFKKDSMFWYCFDKSIMPSGEKLSLRIIPTKNGNGLIHLW